MYQYSLGDPGELMCGEPRDGGDCGYCVSGADWKGRFGVHVPWICPQLLCAARVKWYIPSIQRCALPYLSAPPPILLLQARNIPQATQHRTTKPGTPRYISSPRLLGYCRTKTDAIRAGPALRKLSAEYQPPHSIQRHPIPRALLRWSNGRPKSPQSGSAWQRLRKGMPSDSYSQRRAEVKM